MAIYSMLSRVWESLDRKEPCTALFIDMSRAFDCVVPATLLQQLERVGIRGPAHDLFQSYFSHRRQSTVIDTYNRETKAIETIQSAEGCVNIGVPQGSILGPPLFLGYINELPSLINHHTVLYADDATVLFVKSEQNDIAYNNTIMTTLKTLIDWLNALNLQTNISKTKIMQFHNYKATPIDLNINIAGSSVTEVSQTDFLGITLDSNLNWKAHLSNINSKISSQCYALSVLVDIASSEVAKSAYYGNIFPLLTYGVIFWGNSVNVNQTFLLQKRCLRIIYSKNSDETLRELFREKQFLTLTGIYILEISLFVRYNKNLFKSRSDCRLRNSAMRGNDYLYKPCSKSVIYEKSTFISAINIYNRLPKDITDISNNNQFKTKLKRWLFNNVFYDLKEFLNRSMTGATLLNRRFQS